MTSKEIRQQFFDYFRDKGHTHVPSAPVVPHGDKTLLFTNAGMNQFKDVFLGQGKRDYTRAVDTQKCIRVSGKHNDLEEVGVDTYHHTFFEMLGNWSFGDYYKKEAIAWAWDLLTNVWGLDKNRLYVTVFRTDDEAFDLWKEHISEDRILRFDEKDNFWEMGETGPCGPCSEIHYDGTPDMSGKDKVNADDPEVIEVWNLVFIQHNRKADGSLEDLSAKHVDTGMGLERIVRVLQGKNSNYDTDIFLPVIHKISELSNIKYGDNEKDDIAMRVISDHVRTVAFTIADGALPGNEGRGYVIRRILRRASRFARNLGFREPMLYKLLPILVEQFSEVFTEILKQKDTIEKVIKGEEESFLNTLEHGITKFEEITKDLNKGDEVSGNDAFLLYDSFGFPLDLTALMARENGFTIDEIGFDKLMHDQKERSRAAGKSHSEEAETPEFEYETEFTGYGNTKSEAQVLYSNGNQIVLDKTPFYVEKGGQVSDTGIIKINGITIEIEDVKSSGDSIVHIAKENVPDLVGKTVQVEVDEMRRWDIMRNHSATHLLHESLKEILGDHIQQQGSLVAPDYLRFDFNHFQKVNADELKKIEEMVNEKIFQNISVDTQELSLEEAQQNEKIKMFFGDKYGSRVRAVSMDPNFSIELCGGTHVQNTSQIGYFKITSESSVAAGIRRIEAITGRYINDYITSLFKQISEKENAADDLRKEIKVLEKEISDLKKQDLASGFDSLINDARDINGLKVVISKIDVDNMDELRDTGSDLRDKINTNGIILLANVDGEKVQLVCAVTDDLKGKYMAGKLVGSAAKFLGGGGGGKPHLATAGGRDVSKLDDLLNNEFIGIIKNWQ